MRTQQEIEREEKIQILLFEYSKLTKKITQNNIYLNDCKNKEIRNFEQLEFNIKETNNLYYKMQQLIEKEIINN